MSNISRDILVKKNNVRWLGITSKSISINKEPIDKTTDDSNGWRTLIDDVGTRSVDVSFSGVTEDTTIRELIFATGSHLYTDITLEFPPATGQTTGDVISGNFYLTGYEESGGDSAGVITFSGNLLSSGEVTRTAGS